MNIYINKYKKLFSLYCSNANFKTDSKSNLVVVGDFTSKLVVWGLCCPICASRSHGNVLAAPREQD